MSEPAEVTFFYDFSSPYAYLGSTQIERVAREAGATVRFSPMLLGAIFKAIGTPIVPIQAASEAKRRYFQRDVLDWASYWGQPFAWPSRFPMRTVLPLRLVLAVEEAQHAPLMHAIFRAYWDEDRDISDPGVLASILTACGIDAAVLERAQTDPAPKQALIDATDRALAAGVCGAPSFLVRTHLFWGQDRLDFVRAALEGWTPE